MTGEIKFIKKQMFGGFNREDVVSYVAKIAQERNEEREANAEAQEKIEVLANKISDLVVELELSKSIISEMEKQNKPSLLPDELLGKESAADEACARNPEALPEASSQDDADDKEVTQESEVAQESEAAQEPEIAQEPEVAAQESELNAEMERYNALRESLVEEELAEEEAEDIIGDEIPEFHFNPDLYRLSKENSAVSENTNEARFSDKPVQENFERKPVAREVRVEGAELEAEVQRYRAAQEKVTTDELPGTCSIDEHENGRHNKGSYKVKIKRK